MQRERERETERDRDRGREREKWEVELLLAAVPVRQSRMLLQDKVRGLYQGVLDTTDMR